MMKRWTILVMLGLSTLGFAAELELARLFSKGMVMQQQVKLPVWGKAEAGAEVVVRFAGQEKKVLAAADGSWMLKLDALEASAKPRVLEVQSGETTLEVDDVLVGEVWLCGGQSNMDWSLAKLTKAKGIPETQEVRDYVVNEIASAKDPLLRQFTVDAAALPGKTAEQITSKSGWIKAIEGSTGDFSGTGYFFGRELRDRLGVPVGLIDANRGGTLIEPWIPEAQYRKSPEGTQFYQSQLEALSHEEGGEQYQQQLATWKAQVAAAKQAGKKAPRKPRKPNNNTVPSALFNGFVAPLAPYAVKGVIWYQGESNTSYRTAAYRQSMQDLIAGWRTHWNQPQLPFIWCQLANKHAAVSEPLENDPWASIQNQQREALSDSPFTGMAVLNDIGEAKNIHPINKVDVGKRLSLWAMQLAYGKKLVVSGPLFRSAQRQGAKVLIHFDHVGSGLMVGTKSGLAPAAPARQDLKYFQIKAQDGKWFWAHAEIIDGNKVLVWHPKVTAPQEVRYAWAANPKGANLYNKEGLPASVFKTQGLE